MYIPWGRCWYIPGINQVYTRSRKYQVYTWNIYLVYTSYIADVGLYLVYTRFIPGKSHFYKFQMQSTQSMPQA